MAESRGGRGNAALTGFRLHRPAARSSGRGQIPHSFGQECPWSRYPGMLWYSRMPRPQAGEPRTTGTQYQGFGRVPTALAYQLPRVAGSTPCLEPSQRAPSAQGLSGPYGQHCDRCVYQPARRFTLPLHVATLRHLLLWSQKHLRSLRAIHIPGVFNRAAEELSRAALPGESRLHPQAVQLIWGRFGAAQVDLFASPETTHCQEFYSLTEATLGTDALAHSWPRGLRKYAFPPVSLLAQTLCKIREDEEQVLLVAPYWPNRTWFPELMLLATAPPWPIPLRKDLLSQRRGTHAPASGPVETPRMVPGWDAEVLGDLPQEVALTIASARAPSTRGAYTLKWNLFVEWCSSHQEDPRRCSIRAVLSFLQQGLERRLSPSTLKVYVAAIFTHHNPVEGKSVGKHNLVVRFLRGARRLNPPRPPSLPSWDLSIGSKSPNNCPL